MGNEKRLCRRDVRKVYTWCPVNPIRSLQINERIRVPIQTELHAMFMVVEHSDVRVGPFVLELSIDAAVKPQEELVERVETGEIVNSYHLLLVTFQVGRTVDDEWVQIDRPLQARRGLVEPQTTIHLPKSRASLPTQIPKAHVRRGSDPTL